MHFWNVLTKLGDSGFTVPGAIVIALWLAQAGQRAHAWRWAMHFLFAGTVVSVTKLLYMAWCIGIPSLDFTGISGHTTMAALLWPVLLRLSAQAGGLSNSSIEYATRTGTAVGIVVGLSRLQLHAHSVSEVLSGLLLGFAVSRAFLNQLPKTVCVTIDGRVLALTFTLLFSCLMLTPAPSQELLSAAAQLFAGHGAFNAQGKKCEAR